MLPLPREASSNPEFCVTLATVNSLRYGQLQRNLYAMQLNVLGAVDNGRSMSVGMQKGEVTLVLIHGSTSTCGYDQLYTRCRHAGYLENFTPFFETG